MKYVNDKFYNFNPNIKEVIAKNIRKYRKNRNLTQEELALLSEISYDFMRRIETGKGQVGFSIQTLYKIAKVLEVSIDELMNEKNTEEVK